MTLDVEAVTPPPLTDDQPARGVIAVVDDDPEISRAIGLWLYFHGLPATYHISAESLLQSVRHDGSTLNLHIGVTKPMVMPLAGAILDLNLPGMTGVELARGLRRLSPTLPVVLMTALREEERIRFGVPPPGVRYVQKPFELEALKAELFPLLS